MDDTPVFTISYTRCCDNCGHVLADQEQHGSLCAACDERYRGPHRGLLHGETVISGHLFQVRHIGSQYTHSGYLIREYCPNWGTWDDAAHRCTLAECAAYLDTRRAQSSACANH